MARNHTAHERGVGSVRGFEDAQKGRAKQVVFIGKATSPSRSSTRAAALTSLSKVP
jgi:hypothetical protein